MSGHNITTFRNKDGKVYALHSYCAHLGANIGIKTYLKMELILSILNLFIQDSMTLLLLLN